MKKLFIIVLLSFIAVFAEAQVATSLDSLKKEILALDEHVQNIDLRMESSKSRFQAGIVVSTIGYSTVITGGLMLGRENDQLGQALLVTGGITGIVGTYLLTDAFRLLAGKKDKRKKKR